MQNLYFEIIHFCEHFYKFIFVVFDNTKGQLFTEIVWHLINGLNVPMCLQALIL